MTAGREGRATSAEEGYLHCGPAGGASLQAEQDRAEADQRVRELKELWLEVFPEMAEYFDHVNRELGGDFDLKRFAHDDLQRGASGTGDGSRSRPLAPSTKRRRTW